MAEFDTADLVQQFKEDANRPATDQSTTGTGADSIIFRYLTRADRHWVGRIAAVAPHFMYGDPVLLATADGGYTYTFGLDSAGNPITPIGHFELREARDGRLLVPGAEFDPDADFTFEGNKIRWPRNVARTFTNGPYARFVTRGPEITGVGVQPTLRPTWARALLVPRALVYYARRMKQDPTPWLQAEMELWRGDPAAGVHGILAQLRTAAQGEGSYSSEDVWWRGIETGAGYERWNG